MPTSLLSLLLRCHRSQESLILRKHLDATFQSLNTVTTTTTAIAVIMRLLLPTLVTAALAGSAAAVTINVYPNSESCNDNSGGLQCGNVAETTCCHDGGGGDIFSAKFIGMDTSGVPDQVSA